MTRGGGPGHQPVEAPPETAREPAPASAGTSRPGAARTEVDARLRHDVGRVRLQAEDAAVPSADEPGPAPPEFGEPEAAEPDHDELSDGDLITIELAEHERWAGSFGDLGTAGSDERARYLLEMAGEGAVSGAEGGAVMGFAMSAIGAAVGQVAGRRLATMAVARGLSATPVPGLGSAIGGVMALAGLAMRDWGETGATIGRMGTGTGYERLANDLEGLAEILDVATSLIDVLAGVLGGIAVGMWVGAVLSAGALSPLAATLSAIAIGANRATTAIGIIVSVVLRPVVTALRALHAFESQGDPTEVEEQGQLLSSAAGQITGAVAGALSAKVGGRAGTAGGNRIDQGITRIQSRLTGGTPAPSATSTRGPRLHVEMPEAPGTRTDAGLPAPSAHGGNPATVAPGAGPAMSSPHAADDFSDFGPLIAQLNEDPVVAARLVDNRPPLERRATPWTKATARAYANRQAAAHRAATGMVGSDVEAGHTAAARHAQEAGIREADWDRQPMMPLHRRRDPDLAVTVTNPDGTTSTNTRHRAQEKLIDDAVARARSGSPDQTLTPQGMLDAAEQVRWMTENTPFAQDNVDALRRSGRAPREPGPAVDPQTGRVLPPGSQGPAPASPGAATVTGATPRSIYPDHSSTLVTANRRDAMAQYQAQVRADPGRESGVWRDSAGNHYVMQGGPGSVAPPNASGPLEVIYHSHPTSADPRWRALNSQPTQAGGDLGVLQYQHGQGPAGKRQTSDLHFPVYDSLGTHVGYGETTFIYDPTHPLPIQVRTTTPGGPTTAHRYASFADFQARTGIGAGGSTPGVTRNLAESQLSADRAAASARVDEATRGLRPGPGVLGVREGREWGRQLDESEGSGVGDPYTANVAGLRPGESVEIAINPPYPPPPGTPAELALLRERVDLTVQAQDDLGRTERDSNAQAAQQHDHDAQLGEAGDVSQSLVEGGESQVTATSRTQATNQQQQTTAQSAMDTLGRTGQEAAAVTTLVGSLRAFQGLAHLFGYLPGSLGASAQTARNDAGRLITTLNRVNETDAATNQIEGQNRVVEADEQRLDRVAEEGRETGGELASGRQQVDELRELNQERLTETEAARDQAVAERRAAASDQERTQALHDDLLARLQSWAVEHRNVRAQALSAARERLVAQGYDVEEAR